MEARRVELLSEDLITKTSSIIVGFERFPLVKKTDKASVGVALGVFFLRQGNAGKVPHLVDAEHLNGEIVRVDSRFTKRRKLICYCRLI